MWNKNERDGKIDRAKGKIEQAVGDLTHDDDLKAEGRVDEAAGKVQSERRLPLLRLHRAVQLPVRRRPDPAIPLCRQAPVELHEGRRGEGGAAGGDRSVAPGLRPRARRPAAPASPERDPGADGAQRLHLRSQRRPETR